jgi:hypothetical protein
MLAGNPQLITIIGSLYKKIEYESGDQSLIALVDKLKSDPLAVAAKVKSIGMSK